MKKFSKCGMHIAAAKPQFSATDGKLMSVGQNQREIGSVQFSAERKRHEVVNAVSSE
jgi:translation elongation factor EF-Ts